MRAFVVKIMYVAFYIMRHKNVPSREFIDFIADTQRVEPRTYIPGNVWRWAEYPAH